MTVPPGQTNVLFTHVEEEMTVPMPSAVEFDDYVIYVGYDPQGALEDEEETAGAAGEGPRQSRRRGSTDRPG